MASPVLTAAAVTLQLLAALQGADGQLQRPGPGAAVAAPAAVPLFRLFELEVRNAKPRGADFNRFADVWLNASFSSPSNKSTAFWGFFDGGDTWRLRWMPRELGAWSYTWGFSDGSLSGSGGFECVAKGASPGVLQPLRSNPHWFSYNGITPVFLKSRPREATARQPQKCDVTHYRGASGGALGI